MPDDRIDLPQGTLDLLILRTLSKSYALAGLRIGFVLGNPELIAALDGHASCHALDNESLRLIF